MRINHIVPASLQESYILDRFSEAGKNFLYNEDIISFDVFCRRLLQDETSDALHLIKVGRLLDQHKEEFTLYGPMIQYPAFIDQVAGFEKQLAKGQVNLNDLDQKNELTSILKILDDYSELVEKERKLDALLQKEKGNHVLLSSNDIFSYRRLEHLIKNGNEEIVREKACVSSRSLMKALNVANECEGVIQDIIARHLDLKDVLVIMTDYATEMPVFMDVADQYHLPVVGLGLNETSKTIRFFISLINLYQHHSIENLCTALSNDCFCIGLSDEMKCYLDTFISSADELFSPFDYVEKYADETDLSDFDKKNYLRIEQCADQQRILILPELETLFSFTNTLDVLSYIYELICNKVFLDQNEISVLMEVKRDIEDCADYLVHEEDLKRFEYILKQKTKRTMSNVSGLQVTDMNHPVKPHQLVYVLGCSSDNYPGFKPLKGIFDESFVEGTSYPSLEERVHFHEQRIDWIHTSGHEIVYSYCCSDYSGKGKELAYGIESLYKGNATLWPVVYNEKRTYLPHHLSEELAEQIYRKDKVIRGSISSFERFFNCPYSYFLKSGLKLNKVEMHQIDAALIGTIQHAIMEHLVDEDPKNYGKIEEKKLRAEVASHFSGLAKMFAKDAGFIHMVEQRMADSLVLVFEFLKEMEINTLFTCKGQEKVFDEIFTTVGDTSVQLKGIIDRYDTSGSYLRIVDYKSSNKKLDKKKVDAGLQLQLLSYLVVATRMLSMRPMGAYYFSMKLDNIPLEYGKFGVSKGIISEYESDEFYQRFMEKEKLSGWTFDDATTLDFDAKHITGLKKIDENKVEATSKMDYARVESVIMDVYTKLVEGLMNGNTAIRPVEEACTFCDFKSICRFKGDEEPVKVIVDNPLSEKESKSDAVE